MYTTLLDTGPLVGYLRPDEPCHGACVEAVDGAAGAGQVATIWDVIGEAYTLLRSRFSGGSTSALVALDWGEAATVLEVVPADRARVRAILTRYGNLGLSYVDALVLTVGERLRVGEIVTLDQEMAVVRLEGGTRVTLL